MSLLLNLLVKLPAKAKEESNLGFAEAMKFVRWLQLLYDFYCPKAQS